MELIVCNEKMKNEIRQKSGKKSKTMKKPYGGLSLAWKIAANGGNDDEGKKGSDWGVNSLPLPLEVSTSFLSLGGQYVMQIGVFKKCELIKKNMFGSESKRKHFKMTFMLAHMKSDWWTMDIENGSKEERLSQAFSPFFLLGPIQTSISNANELCIFGLLVPSSHESEKR